MCFQCFSAPSEEASAKRRSKKIERIIDESNRTEKKVIKILLLGTGESGKSTVLRQMRIIYGEGFKEAERKNYIESILLNILNSMITLCCFVDHITSGSFTTTKRDFHSPIDVNATTTPSSKSAPPAANLAPGFASGMETAHNKTPINTINNSNNTKNTKNHHNNINNNNRHHNNNNISHHNKKEAAPSAPSLPAIFYANTMDPSSDTIRPPDPVTVLPPLDCNFPISLAYTGILGAGNASGSASASRSGDGSPSKNASSPSFNRLREYVRQLNFESIEPEYRKYAKHLVTLEEADLFPFSADTSTAICELWKSNAIRRVFAYKRSLQIPDNVEHYFSALDRILASNYLPTTDDILRTRSPTTDIVELPFTVNGCTYKMVDVGGQRTKRHKWIRCFAGVTSIIFVVAISEFGEYLAEDHKAERMRESMALFEAIVNYDFFAKTSMILFFNKIDIFEEKLKTVRFSDYYPEFTRTNATDIAEDVKIFILHTFWGLVNNKDDKPVYFHFTCATNTENIAEVFNSVRQTVLIKNLQVYELL